MTSLPIFRLPQLVYIKIINQMNPAEQLLTALCSRKAYALVRNHRSKAINLTLYTNQRCFYLSDEQKGIYKRLELCASSKDFIEIKKEEKSIDINENRGLRCTIDNQNNFDLLKVCWNDRIVGLRNMFELACDIFRIVLIGNAHIKEPEDIWIIDWLKTQQIILETLYFYDWSVKITDENIKHVILGSTAQELYIHARPTANFQIQNISNTFGLFFCSKGFWITIDNLIELDCIEFHINRKSFTCRELNQFLNHWINGGSPRLKFLRISVDEYNQNELFAGIENHLTRVPGDRFYTSPYKSKFTFNGIQLHRKDAVIASIQHFGEEIFLGVWPDANGNALF